MQLTQEVEDLRVRRHYILSPSTLYAPQSTLSNPSAKKEGRGGGEKEGEGEGEGEKGERKK